MKENRKTKLINEIKAEISKNWFQFLSFLLIFFVFFFLPGQNIYQKKTVFSGLAIDKLPFDFPSLPPFPKSSGIIPPQLTAEGIVVVDLSSGVFLYKKNENLKFFPASTTKIMTALVVLDHYLPEDILEVKRALNEGRVMGLVRGEKITVENLLYGLLIHSGNDAGFALVDNYPGGLSAFLKAMNKKAEEIGLQNTSFTNPVGFETTGHFTTPQDLAKLAFFALSNKTISKMVGIKAITVSDVSYSYFHSLENVNQLLGKIPGVAGIKTGWTENAGECLVSLIEKQNRKILIVLLKSGDRFGETEKLINWIFQDFRWVDITPQIQEE